MKIIVSLDDEVVRTVRFVGLPVLFSSIKHGYKTTNLKVSCFDINNKEIIPKQIKYLGLRIVEVTFSQWFSGMIIVEKK
jgi:hypothetical protein